MKILMAVWMIVLVAIIGGCASLPFSPIWTGSDAARDTKQAWDMPKPQPVTTVWTGSDAGSTKETFVMPSAQQSSAVWIGSDSGNTKGYVEWPLVK